ncbi:DUF3560 domain-containing protein [Parapedobacter sp. ISTM3]|uniref:DUF3560 domain-containing protein n=1 Tax=Parapedobacter sp. ISTM3 TaxID=2800130 RepID=UPI0019062FBA|nr:DUF3560 domain-containing protein [Parapedobacter sp. ISTM3]MBK1439783.1 DUF3560 domain-containing protein [Parapedobacter sp. ISTM3]
METENYFLKNEESEKLNIFTTKQFYDSLIPDQKRVFRKYCLWSPKMECWVSKGKAVNSGYLKGLLKNLGFEDRGAVGQRLPFAEQVAREQERAAMRAERAEKRADKADRQSDALYNAATEMSSAIPFGQPILIGHHSEQRDRRYRERMFNTMGKSVKEQEKAAYYRDKAETAKATAEGAKLKNPKYLSNRIKEAKAAIRLYNRRLEGKLYRGSPGREISDNERKVYSRGLEEYQEKLDFYEACLASLEREAPEHKQSDLAKKSGKKHGI